jgi:hypothetical protein
MAHDLEPEVPRFDDGSRPAGRGFRRTAWGMLAVMGLALALYYPVGMALVHAIDDDPDFAASPALPVGASRAVALAAALIEREVDRGHWAANDPFFLPGFMLDDMPNFQAGIVAALARLTQAVNEQMARPGGKGRLDADLDRAAGLLKYPPDVWIFDLKSGFGATASSEAQYRAARKALLAYNDRIAAKRATFERRPDALLAVLELVVQDIDTQAALIDARVAESAGNLLDFAADDVFYAAKGRLYAYALFLRELGQDFDRALAEKKAEAAWKRMLDAMREAAVLHPWVVFNGAPDSVLLPSHLAGLGYLTLRARARIADAAATLK